MSLRFHATILATSLIATAAVGIASASIYTGAEAPVAAKTDRLPVVSEADTAYLTVERREAGVSVLSRVPVTDVAVSETN